MAGMSLDYNLDQRCGDDDGSNTIELPDAAWKDKDSLPLLNLPVSAICGMIGTAWSLIRR